MNETPKNDSDLNRFSILRVNKLKELEKANVILNGKVRELENLCFRLKNENKFLREKYEEFMNTNENQLINEENDARDGSPPPEVHEYCTDEDELNQETNWILNTRKKNKKKKTESPSEVVESSDKDNAPTLINKEIVPPPIVISGVTDYTSLYSDLKKVAKKTFTVKLLRNGTYKINTVDGLDYRSITENLNKENCSWFTYEDKQTRPIRVLAKNLHHSCDPKLIVEDLISQGLKAIEAMPKLKWQTKEPLDMFYLLFDPIEDINKIYAIKTILASIVKIESISNSKKIPQCKNCQTYGHTKNYCAKEARCVKCTGKHPTESCKKPENQPPKCVNCGELHPASYRGCVVAKELQRIRNQARRQKTVEHQQQQQEQRRVNQQQQYQQYPQQQQQQQYQQIQNGQYQNNYRRAQHKQYQPAQKQREFQNHQQHEQQYQYQVIQPLPPKRPSYADVIKPNNTKVNENQASLQQILDMLKKQEIFNKSLERRLDILEQSTSSRNNYG